MGRYMKKCRGIGEFTVMEVSQVVGVRTRAMTTALAAARRAAKRRKAVSSAAAEYQIAYIQLRSRSLVMTAPPRISRSGTKSSVSGSPRCLTPDRGEMSWCESNASCENAAELRSDHQDASEDSVSVACYSSFRRERRETTPSSYGIDESYDVESTTERRSPLRSTAVMMPTDAEIEEFFAAAENKETQRFARTYNYDVVNDVPLDGRYEWVPVAA